MFENKMEIGKRIDAKDLFEKINKSRYMKKGGYKILYSRTYYEEISKVENREDGISVVKKETTNKIIGYGLCFAHDRKMLYIHIRIFETGLVSGFNYAQLCGDEKKGEKDLIELAKEIKNK